MISHLILFLLFIAPSFAAVPCQKAVGHRVEPCMPDRAERDSMMGKIDLALVLESKWRAAREEENDLREALEKAKRQERKPSLEALETWKASEGRLIDAEREMRRSFSDVIKATQESYGIGPKKRQGTIKGGPLDSQQAFWTPVIQENEDLIYRSGPERKPAYLRWREAAGDGAATMADGTVFVSIDLLRGAKRLGSPAVVAALIDHEAAHFEELIDKKGWTGFDSGQYRAYLRHEQTGAAIGLERSPSASITRTSRSRENGGRGIARRLIPKTTRIPPIRI
ncbi:MAG: hypothetical protein FD126_1323 [Elusimicrobia bacterium]|nr:MAG: hypothetical protein FD126_1323 [Elusimicrobiota bacterium]